MEDQKNKNTIEFDLWQHSENYKNDTNLINFIDQAQRFYNGDQYPNENYKNMPRTTMNICSFMVTIKSSKICGTPLYFTFTSDNPDIDCTKLRQFDEYNRSKLNEDAENYQSAINGYTNGTEIAFLRWDYDDTPYKGIYKGGLKIEHLDPRNFAVANPYIQDIQNQKWVMFRQQVPCEALKDLIEGKDKEEKYQRLLNEVKETSGIVDDDKVPYAQVSLYTRYFRKDGEVFFMCSTKTVNIFEYPHQVSRKAVKEKAMKAIVDKYNKDLERGVLNENGDLVSDYDIDYEDIAMQVVNGEKLSDSDYSNMKEKFSLYPFAVFRPIPQNNTFYGRSDIKSLIPIQKAINFMLSMLMKCTQNNAYNQFWAKPDALQNQELTNEPGQILIDYSQFTNGWGFKMAETQPLPNGLLDFTDRLIAMTRVIYGFNDVMDGSVTNQDMSGYMLQQMIKQSNTAIEQQQKLFWQFAKDLAEIRLLFYKHYVEEAKYTYELTESEYNDEVQAQKQLYNVALNKKAKGEEFITMPDAEPKDFTGEIKRTKVQSIKGEELYGNNFDIAIDAVQGLSDSKLVEQQMWDNLLLNGGINNIAPEILEMYLEASPNVSPRTKSALKSVVERLKQSENEQLKQQLQEAAEKMQQLVEYEKQQEAKLNYLQNYSNNLQKEFSNKITNQNKIINGLMKDLDGYKMQSTPTELSEGEVKSNNAKGIEGTSTQ